MCPDLTYYDKQIAKQAAAFMATLAADGVEVSENLSGKERDEFEDSVRKEITEDLAHKLKKDPELIDEIPQQLADQSAVTAIKDKLGE